MLTLDKTSESIGHLVVTLSLFLTWWKLDRLNLVIFLGSLMVLLFITLVNCVVVVVVYHATIVAIGHGLLKFLWPMMPMVIGCVLRTAGSSII